MSYDLMVFQVGKAPQTEAEFMQWYEKLTEWEEDHSYDDISLCCPALQGWYREMLQSFPAMNGPDAASEEELDADEESGESRISDYCIAKDAIYVAFAWSQADNAYQTVRALAQKHGVGFFDVSGDGDIILPDKPTYSMRTQDYHYKDSDLTVSVIADHLKQLNAHIWDFMVLEPSTPIGGTTFVQVGAPSEQTEFKLAVEIGLDNPHRLEMYRYYTGDKHEILQLLTAYLEEQKAPDFSSWQDISDEVNG